MCFIGEKKVMKKKTAVILLIIAAVAAAVFAFSSCGEGGEPVTVKIMDCGNITTVDGTDGMTVRKLLEKAGVSFSDKDEVHPPLDRKWSDVGGNTITVRRYAKVIVVYGEEYKEVEMIGGTVDLAISKAGYIPGDVTADADRKAFLYDGMVINLKRAINGLVKEKGKLYMYVEGNLKKDGIVGNKKYGYYYADKDGVIDRGFCAAVTYKGKDWNVIKGEASRVVTPSDKTMFNTLKVVEKCTDSSMSKEEKLNKCFYYIKEHYLEGVRHDPPYIEQDWPQVYADDVFVYGKGDCYSYGAAFAYVGRAIGCEESYACNSIGHGWSEIDGLVYDIEWSLHSTRDWIGVSYDENTEVKYANALNTDFEWKRMKITGTFSKEEESVDNE